MRSEKEIREKDFKDFYDHESGIEVEELKSWLLEGEPRYSVAELEKILNSNWGSLPCCEADNDRNYCIKELLKFLKDAKRVKGILEATGK